MCAKKQADLIFDINRQVSASRTAPTEIGVLFIPFWASDAKSVWYKKQCPIRLYQVLSYNRNTMNRSRIAQSRF